MKIDLIMLSHNNLEYTEEAIKNLYETTDKKDFRLILVDNGSEKQVKEALWKLKKNEKIDILINSKENLGFPKGVNTGFQEVKSKFFGILNNDILFSTDWLKKLKTPFFYDERIAITSPLRLKRQGTLEVIQYQYEKIDNFPIWQDYLDIPLSELKIKIEEYNKNLDNFFNEKIAFSTEHTMTPFFCVLLRSDIFKEIGGLDEDFGIGLTEDTYYCRLIRNKGYCIAVVLNCFVYHFVSRTFLLKYTEKEMRDMMIEHHKLMEEKLKKREGK